MKALLLSAGLVAGLVGADRLAPGPMACLVVGVVGVGCLTGARRIHGRDPARGELLNRVRPTTLVLVLAGVAALGFADLGIREVVRLRSPLAGLDGRVVELYGTVASDPQPSGRGSWFVLRSIGTSGGRSLEGRLAVISFGDEPKLTLGDRVRTDVKIAALDPGDPFDRLRARKGLAARATLLAPPAVISGPANPLIRASNLFRAKMAAGARAALGPRRAPLLLGLTIGDDRALSPGLRKDFRASGLSHLTAVSGANLAVVLSALGLLTRGLKLPRRACIICDLSAILLFVLVTRWEPSVLRASVMASMVMWAFLLGRQGAPLHTIGAALFGLLVFDPRLAWSPGFQLSFAATAGILLLRKPLVERLGRLPRLLSEPLAISLGAQLAVFPLIALTFKTISVASIPANLAAAPLVAPVTVLGLMGGGSALVSRAAARPFFQLSGIFAGGLEAVARVFGRSQLSQIAAPGFGGLEFVGAGLLLIAGWLWLLKLGRRARWPAVGAVVLLAGAALVPIWRSPAPAGLRVTFFDVGQGDAVLIETPGGARALVDGGPDPNLVAGLLKRRGIHRLDLVVASHLHADHVRGLAAVLKRFDVGIAVDPGVNRRRSALSTSGKPLEQARPGERIQIGDLAVQIMAPDGYLLAAASGPDDQLDNASVAVRVEWAGQCVLLTGDLEQAGQQALMEAYPQQIRCTVMKAPHHGSANLDPLFVQAVGPDWVPISVGPNTFGHPSPRALKIIAASGARVLRTDRQSNLVIEISGSGKVRLGG